MEGNLSRGFNWTCPHCQRHVTITNTICHDRSTLHIENSVGRFTLSNTFIVCPNPNCRKFTLTATLHESSSERTPNGVREVLGNLVRNWSLIPSSNAKVFPEYVPVAIKADYEEASLILDLSPKASATLARRCLQGIIRDFWCVKPARLVDEIKAIKESVDPLTWDAIEAVRKVGNIGAHMEKDIDVIVDVEPNEAALLLNLIEMLVHDWYIVREERKKRLQSIVSLGAEKENARKYIPES
jgi:hypothetical protein